MTYQVLARKWRPKDFASLVGQEHVVRALTHALEQQRLHHAYLFTGTRGVGKTTLSRILAKALNCETGITAVPCGVCQACTAIDGGRFIDYIEMDAASNRGVEEMASLLERAVYAPVDARFKVYMIDEVHMLTNHAFNAMLKTLEEPPAHVKFILATTDPQKIPVTVLSRCLQFNLKQMPATHIVEHLQHVLDAEGIASQPQALRLLARAADGSMRDALSLADQAIAYSAGNVDEVAVQAMLGTLDQSYLIRLLDSVMGQDGAAVLAVADEMATRSLSFATALQDLAGLLHRIAWAQYAPGSVLDEWPEALDIRRFAATLDAETVQLYYQIATLGRSELGLAPDEYAGFTMTLLRMLAFMPTASRLDPAGSGSGGSGPSGPIDPAAVQNGSKIATPKATHGSAVFSASPSPSPPMRPVIAAGAELSTAATAVTPLVAIAETAIKGVGEHLDMTAPGKLQIAPGAGSIDEAASSPGVRGAQAAFDALRGAGHKLTSKGVIDPPAGASTEAADDAARLPAEGRKSGVRTGAGGASAIAAMQLLASRASRAHHGGGGSQPAQSAQSSQLSGSSGSSGPRPTLSPAAVAQPELSGNRAKQANPGAEEGTRAPQPQHFGTSRPVDPKASSVPPWEDLPPLDDYDALSAAHASFEDVSFGDEGAPETADETSGAPSNHRDVSFTQAELPPPIALDSLGFDGDWPGLAIQLPLKGIAYQLAFNSELTGLQQDCLTLAVPVPQYAETSQVAKLRLALAEKLGRVVTVEVNIAPARRTAAALAAIAAAARQHQAELTIEQDPFVQSLIREFDAKIIDGSIRPV